MTDYQREDKCWCLKKLQHDLKGNPFCPTHKENHVERPQQVFVPPKQRIGKYSGKSKTPYGGYNDR